MDSVDVVKSAFSGAHMWYQGTVGDLTEEQANAVPPGVSLPIGALMAHILHCEDFMINHVIRDKPPIWERDGWKDRVGGELLLDIGPETGRSYKANLAPLNEYGQAVLASTDTFLAGLDANELDRELNLVPLGFPSNMTMGAFLTQMLLGNTYAHTGEISSLKGSLGKQGYPF